MTLPTFCFILATLELLIGIPMLILPGPTTRWFLAFKKNDDLLRVVGVMFLILAVLVLVEDPAPGTDIAGLMRVVAWLTALKSLSFCWYPKWHTGISERFLSASWRRCLMGVIAVSWGVLFLLAGVALK